MWAPGAAACVLFFSWYAVLSALPFEKDRGLVLSVPYLAVLPFGGALGAFLSRRMKGSVGERLTSALFPVFAFIALFALRIVYGLFLEGIPYTLPHCLDGLGLTVRFILVGGSLLVLGAWPFCRRHSGEASS